MLKSKVFGVFIVSAFSSSSPAFTATSPSIEIPPAPPVAEKQIKKFKKYNHERIDNYYWMRERDNPKVKAYLEAENEYVSTIMKPTEELQKKLISEMRARTKEDDESAPIKRGEYYYFVKYETGAEYPIFGRRKKWPNAGRANAATSTRSSAIEILLNVNELAKKFKYYDVATVVASPDQRQIVFAADTVGRRFYDLYFKDLSTKKLRPEVISQTTGNVVWMNDNRTILFSRQDPETLRSFQIYKYQLPDNDHHPVAKGKTKNKPELIYEETDPQFSVSVSKSLTQNEVYIDSISNTANEVRVANANDLEIKFKIFMKRQKDHEYSVFDGGDRYYILTNNKAKNFRLVEADKNKPERKYWREVVGHRPKVLIEDVLVLKNHLVLQEREGGLTQIVYAPRLSDKAKPKSHAFKKLAFPDPTYVAELAGNAEYDTKAFRYNYQSLTQPKSVYDFYFENHQANLIKTIQVPTYIADEYQSKRLFAKARDGVKVPISLVYKKSRLKKSGNPLYVYAYGSYGYSTDTDFRSTVVSLLDRGFIFAIAHVRGGSEMGRHWYDNGKLLKKKNTFTDFIVCTERLLKAGYGKKGHVYAMGGSAGGLLMGVILNMRPDLYNGVIAAVPFVDVVTTMLDDTIPLTTSEYEEWGNPNEKKYYKYISSYSPYDNIKKQNYPNVLVTTGFHDSQVQYWEPAKWVAKLRNYNTSKNIILFKTDLSAGHSGTTGRFESLKEDALDYAFLLMLEKINK